MKKGLTFVISIFIIIAIAVLINSFLPRDLEDGFFDISGINSVEYQSELIDVGNKKYGVYAFLNENATDTGNDEFVISVIEVKGILKNKYDLISYNPQSDDFIIDPQYENIVNFPEYEIKTGSKYYGSVYCGIAPINCNEIIIDGERANMERMTFDINGNKADFYLYYCILKQDEYPDDIQVICADENGEKFEIKTVDGAEY
ncbi:MAG: hypothetical protein J1F23_00960 [Oscillospiraceae bacterium]|nr:hypothetical protein [Oscillospiraceae bacterium]